MMAILMGYRHYLYAVPKKQVAEIQSCKTNEDWCNFAENYGYKVDRDCCDDGSGWFSPYKIGTELYELGKYSEIAFKMESERPSLFTSEELKERYSDPIPDDILERYEYEKSVIFKMGFRDKDLIFIKNNPYINMNI